MGPLKEKEWNSYQGEWREIQEISTYNVSPGGVSLLTFSGE